MADCYIYDAVRTPRTKGRAGGAMNGVKPVDLAVAALRGLEERHDLDTSQLDDVILGCVEPVGEQGGNIARIAALYAGYDQSVPGVQLNRFCSSGLVAVNLAAARVMSGMSDAVVGGGVESMSRIPMGAAGGHGRQTLRSPTRSTSFRKASPPTSFRRSTATPVSSATRLP